MLAWDSQQDFVAEDGMPYPAAVLRWDASNQAKHSHQSRSPRAGYFAYSGSESVLVQLVPGNQEPVRLEQAAVAARHIDCAVPGFPRAAR